MITVIFTVGESQDFADNDELKIFLENNTDKVIEGITYHHEGEPV